MTFPAISHIALTVRDREASVPWYQAMIGTDPLHDEHTDAGFRHVVWQLSNGTLISIHQHDRAAEGGRFSEFRVGLDHVGFGCRNRAELEARAEEIGGGRDRTRRHRRRELRFRLELSRPRRHRPGVLHLAGVAIHSGQASCSCRVAFRHTDDL